MRPRTTSLVLASCVGGLALAQVTYLWDCLGEDPMQQPETYVLTCADGNAGLESLSWSAWGEAVAHAQGEFVTNSCEPSCAEGELVRFPVTVRAEGLRRMEASQVYGAVTVHFVDARPEGMAADERFVVGPVEGDYADSAEPTG